MRFTFSERIFLCMLLPKYGTVETLRMTQAVLKKIEVTNAEIVSHKIQKKPDGNLAWENGKLEYEIALNEMEQDFVAGVLADASLNKRLGIQLLETYDKFIP